eukprot:753056-Prymnesium_polylepis.1
MDRRPAYRRPGPTRSLVIRDVRIVEGANGTLVSVRQLWIQQHWDCCFGKSNTVHVVQSDD